MGLGEGSGGEEAIGECGAFGVDLVGVARSGGDLVCVMGGGFKGSEDVGSLGARCGGEVEDDGEGCLAFFEVFADGLSDGLLAAGEVEEIVLDLEGDTEAAAIQGELLGDLGRGPGDDRATLAARGDERGGLAVDDLEVGRLVDGPVFAVVDLEELAGADDAADFGDGEGVVL